ncbi:MAG: FMN-binding negative transcriptional regulator [Brucellaceae bacterium]|nr:FMN-binding negative transcriptional regulator [Brucellaceae bacterium]
MHPNPAFRQESEARSVAFARERSFGILAVNADGGPLISHVPFVLDETGAALKAHLVRSNPILRLLGEPVPAVIAVSGPDAYLSPDWYGVDDQVPTWNYVAVHLRGTLRRLDDGELHGILDELSALFEQRLAPKKPWTSAKMDQEIYGRMLRQIVPVAMEVERIDATWKLSQNKPQDVRLGAIAGLEGAVSGSEIAALAALMAGVETG